MEHTCKCWTGTRKEILLPWGWRCCTSALCRGRKKTESEGISKSLWPPAGRSLRPHRPWSVLPSPSSNRSEWLRSQLSHSDTHRVRLHTTRTSGTQPETVTQLPDVCEGAASVSPLCPHFLEWRSLFVSEKGVRLRRGSGGECWQYRDSRRTKNLRRNNQPYWQVCLEIQVKRHRLPIIR